MNAYDAERERIGRQLEEGSMTLKEHRHISRAIDRAEKYEREADARNKRILAQQEKYSRKRKQARQALRDKLIASQEVWS